MIPSKELFELIKSLDQGERRHFSNYSNLHSSASKNYLSLFNAINHQKEYNEQQLKSELSNQTFTRYLPVAKNYLYFRIIDSLANFHSDISANAKVRTLIQQIEVLQKKGLYSQSKKIITRTKKIAYQEELYFALLEIISIWEQNILIEKYKLGEAGQTFSEIMTVLSKITEEVICGNAFLRMLSLYYSYFQTRNKKYLKEASALIRDPDFIKAENTGTYKGKQRALEANMFYWYIKGNLKMVSRFAKKGIEHNFNHPLGLKKDCKQYFTLLNNFFVVSMEQKIYTEAKLALNKFDAVSNVAKTYSQKGGFYYTYSNCLIYYLRVTGGLEELKARLPAILSNIDLYKKDINLHDRAVLLSNIAVSEFYLGNYKKCVYFLNTMKTEYDLSDHPELQYGYYLLTLIGHYEAGNYDVLPYALQAFYRFLKKKESITKFENRLIALCKDLISVKTEKEVVDELKKFRKMLALLKGDYVSHHISKVFDVMSWIDRKIGKVGNS